MTKRMLAILAVLMISISGAMAALPVVAEIVPGNPAKSPFGAVQTDIEAVIEGMTTREKVAQLFLARCPSSGALKKVQETQPGGYILFANHFEGKTPEQIAGAISGYQAASKIPMLIGVDEEGGTVTRISRFKAFRNAKFASPRALFDQGGLRAILDDLTEKDALLRSLGVNFNLAPVADVSVSRGDYMYSRSLGQDAETTALYVAAVVQKMNRDGIAGALKHFPGYGNNRDTHSGIAVDKRSYESFVETDFVPFQAGIAAGAGCILVSHNIVNCMDGDRPASLSPEVHRVLREELGFEGVIMTDDLYMGAIKRYTDAGSAAVLAIEAGNDLLCVTDYDAQFAAVLEAVDGGRISLARIEESVRRILTWKQDLGMLP